MMISKQHDFGFVHIPKCAGSSIRQQLRDMDDLGERFYHTMTLPDFGRINGNHVPLEILERYFPEDLAALRNVTSYAIVREPGDRFRSAVAQYLRSHVREPAELGNAELLSETDRIIEGILEDADQREIRNTIFYQQRDYVHLKGEKVINHVFRMDDIGALFAQLETRHSLVLERDTVWNPTVTYRVPGTSGGLKNLKTLAHRILPTNAYMTLRDFGIRLFTTKGVPQLDRVLQETDRFCTFVDTYYAADIALYQALESQGNTV